MAAAIPLSADVSARTSSTTLRRAGVALSTIAVLFLTLDAAMKLVLARPVVEAMPQSGWPVSLAQPLGAILLACVAIHLVPRTAVIGAVLLTGYLGGAIATNLRIGNPLFTHTLFPIYVAVLVWGGLYLRDSRVRALIAKGGAR
jgi:hypothetical protein